MRVAVYECIPNHESAEKELVKRFMLALENLGWEAVRAICSDDVIRFKPDCVIATHYYIPKMTGYPTFGLMTNPTEYFEAFPKLIANILSYDGYLTGSSPISEYLANLAAPTGKSLAFSPRHFHLSCPKTTWVEREVGPRRLFYCGMRWDFGTRHGSLFADLAAQIPLEIYGPKERWADLPQCYRGRIPFDGVSVLERLRAAGVALCIHSAEHRRWEIPTMRIFEAAAAGAVIITDAEEFGRAHFGDDLLYIDASQPGEDVVRQIVEHMNWIHANPADATAMVRRAHTTFNERLSLERDLEMLPELVDRTRGPGGFITQEMGPRVEYIVRAGTRPVEFVKRALDSLLAQSYSNIGVVLVWLGPTEDLNGLIREYRDRFVSLRVVHESVSGIRSHALWAGLGEVAAPYFGILDDDDTLQPNHVASVMRLLTRGARLARSGGIRVQDNEGDYEDEPHFHGPLGDFVPETRRLAYFDLPGRRQAMVRSLDDIDLAGTGQPPEERPVLSNSWIASRELLTAEVMQDPQLEVVEDVYLYCQLADGARCAYTWRPTAEWHWRSKTEINASRTEAELFKCKDRVRTLRSPALTAGLRLAGHTV